MDEYTNFEKENTLDGGWKAFMFCAWSALMLYTGYNWGYGEARYDYSTPIKYKCYEGVVYRNSQGYWEDTKQGCKTLEQVK